MGAHGPRGRHQEVGPDRQGGRQGPGRCLSDPREDGAFFGRRKGKALRAGQAGLLAVRLPGIRLDLDVPAPTRLAELFARPVAEVRLEIGYGGGEHLARCVAEAPEVGFIGCEAYLNGTASLLAQLDEAAAVRLWDDDAARLINWLPESSLGRIHVNYPDPWPKRRHRKRRFLQQARLMRLAALLQPGGELHFATDIDDYAGFVLARAARVPGLDWTARRAADWLEPWPGWQSTRYELKALREGRRPGYFTFRRVGEGS